MVSPSEATAHEGVQKTTALVEITMGDDVFGYITGGSDTEHRVVRANAFGTTTPRLFRTHEGALEQMLSGAADKFEEKPQL